MSNTGIPRVQVAAGTSNDEQPEVDVSNEEFLQFDTSGVPVIVTLAKVTCMCYLLRFDHICDNFIFIPFLLSRLGLGRHYIVDATSEEESQISSAVSLLIGKGTYVV